MSTSMTLQPKAALPKPKRIPPYHVVLLDDQDHSYPYVIQMLRRLFGHSFDDAFQLAREVDQTGRAIVDTTTLERAELKQLQIHGFGADRLVPDCRGAMSAVVEPADC